MKFPYFLGTLVILLCVLISKNNGEMNFAVISDLHIGESGEADALTQEAIDEINLIHSTYNLSFVIITGDITSSALPSQYERARRMLDGLSIPYYPIFGNHDVWVYTRPTNETSWEEKVPTGDALFVKYFEDIFIRDNITYNFDTVWNPEQNINSTFINWEMRFPSPSGTFVLFGLDFVTREAATNPKDLYKGAAPTASLHNFPRGTLQWFEERLDQLPEDTVSVVTAHHHTVTTTPFFTPDYFSMNVIDRESFKNTLLGGGKREKELFWGALVGHMHFWDTSTALMSTYQQWETTAAKQAGRTGIAIVRTREGTIVHIERCCGVSELDDSLSLARMTLTSGFLFLFSIIILKLSYSFKSCFVSFLLKLVGFLLLVGSEVYPLTGGNGFITKHINVNCIPPVVLTLVLILGIAKNRLTRNSIFGLIILIIGNTFINIFRYPIRTSWLYDGDNFNIFWFYFSCIFVFGVQAIRVRGNTSQYQWAYPFLLSVILGILLELMGGTVSSVLFRMLSPITLSLYECLERVTIISLAVIFISQQIVASVLARNKFDLFYCVSIAASVQTICNATSQLILRTSSYPIPFVFIMSSISLVPILLGIIILTKDLKEREKKKEGEYELLATGGLPL